MTLYERNNFLLPIWHGISKADVYEYSPQLTNRLAANWADGVDKVVPMILRALGRVRRSSRRLHQHPS